jgi:hypothetical protein
LLWQFQPDITQSDLAGLERDERRLRASAHAESFLDALDVPVNRVLTDGQMDNSRPMDQSGAWSWTGKLSVYLLFAPVRLLMRRVQYPVTWRMMWPSGVLPMASAR